MLIMTIDFRAWQKQKKKHFRHRLIMVRGEDPTSKDVGEKR